MPPQGKQRKIKIKDNGWPFFHRLSCVHVEQLKAIIMSRFLSWCV